MCEQDLLNAALKNQNFRHNFDFTLPEIAGDMGETEKPDMSAFGSWIRSFQLDNGSIAAYDYAFAFVKVHILNIIYAPKVLLFPSLWVFK